MPGRTAERRIVLLPLWEKSMSQTSSSGNCVLSHLSGADLALLIPHLEPVDLPLSMQLETANQRIGAVYLIDRGFASVVAEGPGKRNIEVGMIGREGIVGLAVVMGHDRARHTTYMQVAGSGQRMSAAQLRTALDRSATLQRTLLLCAHAFLIQTTETAIANGRSKNEERLARWLLMAQDRIDGSELPLSHKLLAIMLGVHRPGVTVALRALERKGLIRPGRKNITILNRKGLVAAAKGAYVRPDSH